MSRTASSKPPRKAQRLRATKAPQRPPKERRAPGFGESEFSGLLSTHFKPRPGEFRPPSSVAATLAVKGAAAPAAAPGRCSQRPCERGGNRLLSPDPPVRGERVGVQVRQIVGRRRAPD